MVDARGDVCKRKPIASPALALGVGFMLCANPRPTPEKKFADRLDTVTEITRLTVAGANRLAHRIWQPPHTTEQKETEQ